MKLIDRFPEDLTEKKVFLFQKQVYYSKPERGGKDSYSISTQRYILAGVRAFCRWAFFAEYTNTNVSDRLELPTNVKTLPRDILSQDEVKKLMESVEISHPENFRDRAILELLYSCAIRADEMIRLDLLDVDFHTRVIHVRGKGGKERKVPMSLTATEWLESYVKTARCKLDRFDEPRALFLGKSGKRLAYSTINVRIQKHGVKAGIETKITAHVFRHTCATHLLKSGADLRYVQEFLGHESPNTTKIYTRVVIADLMEMHDKFHPRDRL